jgi:hypothetical protein
MLFSWYRLSAAMVIVLGGPAALAAQADVVRGRVIGPDSTPIERATITVTSLRGNVSRTTRTDKDGRYTVAFPGSDGDYFVSVAALGFGGKRFEVKRIADQEILVGNARLSIVAQQLDAVKVDAARQRIARGEAPADIGGSERATNSAAVTADPFADLAALAASLPGVQLIPSSDGPSGFSVLGLTADQNVTTLNGMTFTGSSLPRDAAVSTSLVTTPYDVARGNFSGGMLAIRTEPGSNSIARLGGVNVDAPRMQLADPVTRSLGQQYRNVSVGGRTSGPIDADRSFYSIAYQAGRRSSDIQSLLNTNAVGLQALGVAADSVARLLSILNRSGVPTTVDRVPAARYNDNAAVFGTLDIAPPTSTSGQAFNVTFNAAWNRVQPALASATELPAHNGDRQSWFGAVQARQSGYYGFGVLSETSVGVSKLRSSGNPFLELPNAVVRINSALLDGSANVQEISFGGNADLAANQATTSAQAINQLSWFSDNNAHRLKVTTELRRDQYAQDLTANRLGVFGFSSLGDVEAGRPSVFMRTLGSQTRSEAQYVGGLSAGDSYKPAQNLQFQYGVRLDGNRFTSRPTFNAQVERAFGVRNDRVPNAVYLSPRAGFSWAYGAAPQVASFEGAVRDPRATIRGGVGIFQNTPNAAQIGAAMDNTGLPGAAQQVACVGSATPIPDWTAYAENSGTIPTRCADGSVASGFASLAPNVALFGRSYSAPRSLRSNVQWAGVILGNRLVATADATYSLNLNQASVVDLNFDPIAKFTLADDKRPIFARPSGIVAASGAIAGGEARIDPTFARVSELRSDMRSDARQLTLQFRPVTFNSGYSWTIAYVYANARERFRGFASAGASPLDVAWSRSSFDSRHQLVYTLTYNALDLVRLSWYGSLRSGTPYTPLVAADINGDGNLNDRAFIYDPAKNADSALATGMRSLLANGSGSARRCLESQIGRIASRNSCQGPWVSASNLTLSLNPTRVRMPQRATLSFQLSNPLGAADFLLHGDDKLHGWGQPFVPTTQLLFVRGFDATTRRYLYEVNQRFGSAAVTQMATRLPVTLTAMLRVDVGPTRERQALTSMLDRGRVASGQRLPEPLIKALYGTSAIVNPMAQILRQADTLALTPRQGDSLAVLNRAYAIALDSIWTPVAKYLAALPDRYDQGEAYDRYRAAREAMVDALIRLAPRIKSLLTADQWRRLPPTVIPYLDTRYLASVRSGTAGTGLDVLMLPNGMPLPAGANNAATAVIMMHGGTP